MKKTLISAFALTLATFAFTSEAAAQDVHDGFFARGAIGVGGASASSTQLGTTAKISGAGVPVVLAVGYGFRNFALHLTGTGAVAVSPTVSIGGHTAQTDNNTAFSSSAGMIGASYYIMPANIYVSASVGAGTHRITNDSNGTTHTSSTKQGPAFQLMAGKEWLVGPKVNLGVAATVLVLQSKDPDDSNVTWTGVSGGLVFSATYF